MDPLSVNHRGTTSHEGLSFFATRSCTWQTKIIPPELRWPGFSSRQAGEQVNVRASISTLCVEHPPSIHHNWKYIPLPLLHPKSYNPVSDSMRADALLVQFSNLFCDGIAERDFDPGSSEDVDP